MNVVHYKTNSYHFVMAGNVAVPVVVCKNEGGWSVSYRANTDRTAGGAIRTFKTRQAAKAATGVEN